MQWAVTPMKWDDVRKTHEEAAEDLALAAERVPAEAWLQSWSEGKWSPAEIVEHLTLAYDVFLRELEGGPGMRIRTKLWQRILLRFTLVPRLLRGAAFPEGARAPRETRPEVSTTDQSAAIATFRKKSTQLDDAAMRAHSGGRRIRLTHAYFGKASLADAILLCARHIQHHRRQLG